MNRTLKVLRHFTPQEMIRPDIWEREIQMAALFPVCKEWVDKPACHNQVCEGRERMHQF